MSNPNPYNVAHWIVEDLRNTSYISLVVAIEQTLIAHLIDCSIEQIADFTEIIEANVFTELGIITEQLIKSGSDPTFYLEGEPGTAYIRGQNLESLIYLEKLKVMSPEAFEYYCAEILSLLGAKGKQVGKVADGGIDFIARDFPISYLGHPSLTIQSPYLFGQAKRYANNFITVNNLREFVGAAILRADEFRSSEERMGIFTPVLFAYWTTSDFNKLARDYAIKTGLWCLSGIPLAQLGIKLGITI